MQELVVLKVQALAGSSRARTTVLAHEFAYSSDLLISGISTVSIVFLRFETNGSSLMDIEIQTHI